MVKVVGGKVRMEEKGGFFSSFFDHPVQSVELSDYEIGQTQVTQELWCAVMGKDNNPSNYVGRNRPVECVSYFDALNFINKLNELTNLTFKLPSEAQWEYAAKGGEKTNGFKYSGSNFLNEVGWYNGNDGTKPVAQKQPNELGIYDMSGNVEEWCLDWHSDYKTLVQKDYAGPRNGEKKVMRGGSYYNAASVCTVEHRQNGYPNYKSPYCGFRLVRIL